MKDPQMFNTGQQTGSISPEKVKQSATQPGSLSGNTFVGDSLRNMGRSILNSTTNTTTIDPNKQIAKNNVAQAAQTMETGVGAVSDNQMSNSIKGLGNTVGSFIPLPGAS